MKNGIRIAVVLNWVCCIAAGIMSVNVSDDTTLAFVDTGLLVAVVTMVVGSIGMLCMQQWGFVIYVEAYVIGLVVSAFTAPEVLTAPLQALDEFGTVMAGVAIGLWLATKRS